MVTRQRPAAASRPAPDAAPAADAAGREDAPRPHHAHTPPADAAGGRDPRWFQVHRDPPRRDVPYLPTDEHVVGPILDFAGVGPGDVFYDLGCGDGRLVVAAARRGATAIGVDIDPLRIRE